MKRYSLLINPFAENDLRIAVDWYNGQKDGLNRELVNEIDKIIRLIQENPFQFAVIRKKIRMAIIKRFPFGIYYYVGDSSIIVFAVFHYSRNPKVLRKRIK